MTAAEGLFDVGSDDPYIAQCVRVLSAVPGWVRTPGRDEELVEALRQEYPDLKLLVELGRWSAWMAEKGKSVDAKGGVLRVRNWFRRGRVFRLESRGAAQDRGRQAARAVRSGARPSSPDEFRSEAKPGLQAW